MNRSSPFSTPDTRAARQISSRYGKVMRENVTARANLPGYSRKPGASTSITCGMKISPAMVSAPSQNAITARVSLANWRAGGWPSAASMPEKAGTKAALKAPSPNRRRNRLGRRRATKKASATGPVPSIAAIIMSRTKPSRRLAMVQPPTVRTLRSMGLPVAQAGESVAEFKSLTRQHYAFAALNRTIC